MPVSVTFPVVTPVLIVTSAVFPTLSASKLPVPEITTEPLPSWPADTVIRFVAETAALIVMSSSASSVTVVGSMAASTVISSAASRWIVPEPVNFALTSMPPVVVPAVTLVLPVTMTVPFRFTSSALTRVRPAPAVLAPETVVESSSVIATAPAELKVSVPALNVPPPKEIDVPATSANSVTSTLVAPASEIAAVESRSRLPAVFTPMMSVPESSLMTTAPVELNVSVPTLNVPLPKVIVPAAKSDEPLIAKLPLSVMEVNPLALSVPPVSVRAFVVVVGD